MAAANWGSGNYLIVKENYIAEQIAPYVNTLSIPGLISSLAVPEIQLESLVSYKK